MRTFVAVEIPGDIQEKIGAYIDSIRGTFRHVKWVVPQNIHFTIKFLGEVHEPKLKNLRDCIAATASEFGPFEVGLNGIGYFPSEKRPRVVWIGADGGTDYLLEVFQTLENCLERVGFDREERTFSPHLTIGRAKKDKKVVTPDNLPEFEPVRFEVSTLALMKSTLTPDGPIYERAFECGLSKVSCSDSV
ncbi:RNA 2',3'-cyclic phosphodiesterase [bacterium]|nr:RNA 2',3'-cyclic phosphodiesterase [bacterium]